MEFSVFITGNVPSLKNGKQWTGKFLTSSATVKNYLKEKGIKDYSASKQTVTEYKTRKNIFAEEIKGLKEFIKKAELEKPYKIEFFFIRKDHRKFDYINIAQIILDLMTAHQIIEDDNMMEVVPVFNGFDVSKECPGVIIRVRKDG